MKIVRQLPFAVVLSAVSLFAAPAPNSVQNPGTNLLYGMANYGIAQGSIFIVYGTGLGPTSIVSAPSLPLQTTLSNTSVSVTVGSTTVPCLMFYTLATQVAALLPSNTPTGNGTLTVTYNGVMGSSTPITVVPSAFGMISVNEAGTGPALATHGDNTVVSATNTTYPGEEIVIWGTGLGPLPAGVSDANSPGANGQNLGSITIYVGGVQVTNVEYHGRNPSDPGLDQINFTIPASVSAGCYVSLQIVSSVNGSPVVSNTTTLAVASSRSTCADANGLSFSTIEPILNSKGSVRIGYLGLSESQLSLAGLGLGSETSVSGSGSFQQLTAAQITGSTGVFSLPSIGSCTIIVEYPNTTTTTTPLPAGLDAGTPIPIMGPTSASSGNLVETSGSKGSYSTPFMGAGSLTALPSGTYTFTGPGGADVGAFMATLKVPANLTWTNETTVTANPIPRANPLTLTWTGGDPSSYVIIVGESENPINNSSTGAIFYCIAPVAPGTFTIPAAVLLSLPPTSSAAGAFGFLEMGSTTTPVSFTATGLDLGYASASSYSGSTVTWQ